jgi:UDP-2,3-diacylglucosamine hydrolase
LTTLFISDLHLDASRPAATQRFIEFLHGEARNAEALYILGDLFEYWLGDDAPTPAGLEVAPELAMLAASGVPCHFMHGNRDFLLGKDYAARCVMQLLGETEQVDLYGRPTLLLHGDSLCTDDLVYQQVRRMVRDPAWQAALLAKTPQERAQFALESRAQSATHQAAADMAIMDVNDDAVCQAFEHAGVRHMIHGHTHRPKVHRHALRDGSGERIVLGDWYEQGSVLRVDERGARLEVLAFG